MVDYDADVYGDGDGFFCAIRLVDTYHDGLDWIARDYRSHGCGLKTQTTARTANSTAAAGLSAFDSASNWSWSAKRSGQTVLRH